MQVDEISQQYVHNTKVSSKKLLDVRPLKTVKCIIEKINCV